MKFLSPACLLVLLLVMSCDQYDVVMASLSQAEANEALVLLREQNIDAKKESEPSKKMPLYQIKVKQSEIVPSLRILVDHRIPRTERAGLKDIYPPGSAGLIPTKSEEHARFVMASQGEIEALFKIIPGIKDARVILSFDPPHDVLKNVMPKTASVVLLYQSLHESSSPISDDDAKKLMASSINGLFPEDITIVQKAIGVHATSSITEALSLPLSKEDGEEKNMVWYMLAVTIMALVVATYGVFRLFVERRARA